MVMSLGRNTYFFSFHFSFMMARRWRKIKQVTGEKKRRQHFPAIEFCQKSTVHTVITFFFFFYNKTLAATLLGEKVQFTKKKKKSILKIEDIQKITSKSSILVCNLNCKTIY